MDWLKVPKNCFYELQNGAITFPILSVFSADLANSSETQ